MSETFGKQGFAEGLADRLEAGFDDRLDAGFVAARRTRLGASALVGIAIVIGVGLGVSGCRRSRPKLTRGDAGIVVDEARLPAGSQPAQVESEPGPGAAAPLVITFGANGGFVLKGTLSGEDTEDSFQMDVPGMPAPGDAAVAPTQQLALTLSPGPALAASLVIVGADALPILRSTGAVGVEHGVPNLAVASGQRLVIVIRRQGKPADAAAAPYTLTGQLADLGAADEREPNGSAAQATLTSPAHTAPEFAGLLGARDDVDWFRIPVGESSEGTVLGITIEPPSDVAVALAVHDQAGTRIQGARGRKGRPVSLRQLAPAAFAAGGAAGQPPAFLLEVRSDGGEDRQHRYLLRVWSEESPSGEREPNDDTAHASVLPDGETSGFLTPGDVDHFRFEGQTGQTVAVTLSPASRSDLILEVLAPGQARWTRVDAQRRGQPESLSLTPAAAGPILVKVSGKGDMSTADEPYRILVERR